MHVFIRVQLHTLIYICICVHGMIVYCDVPVYVHACRVVVVYTGVLHCMACIYHIVAVYITMRIVHYTVYQYLLRSFRRKKYQPANKRDIYSFQT